MKRGGPPRRKALLRASGRPQASKAARGHRHSPKPRVSPATLALVAERAGGRCECGCGRRAEDPHHIFDKQKWPHLIDEADNIVAVARYCHANHTNHRRLLPRYAVRRAERFATTEAMRAYLEHRYESRALP